MMLARATVRYHHDDGCWWADCGGWTGVAATLAELRLLACEGLGFTHGDRWESRCYFEVTDQSIKVDPIASEEFERALAA